MQFIAVMQFICMITDQSEDIICINSLPSVLHLWPTNRVATNDASDFLLRYKFRYDIDTIFTKYHNIDIMYVSKMHTFWFCRLKF